ncbi:Flagellar hook-length control protein FliK [plant metagenome]|uniref:Flagellar hook-length control protein FliK n=1 Tax=plant metagenome TaxID=1297885 RepID=A0A484NWP2_9ZZZZ
MTNIVTTLIASPAQPAVNAASTGAADSQSAASPFSQVLADQRSAGANDGLPEAGHEPVKAGGKRPANRQEDADTAESAQTPEAALIAQATLPEQALDIALQVAAQLRGAGQPDAGAQTGRRADALSGEIAGRGRQLAERGLLADAAARVPAGQAQADDQPAVPLQAALGSLARPLTQADAALPGQAPAGAAVTSRGAAAREQAIRGDALKASALSPKANTETATTAQQARSDNFQAALEALAAPQAAQQSAHATHQGGQSPVDAALLAHAAQAPAHASPLGQAPAAAPVLLGHLATPVGAPGWSSELGRQMIVMSQTADNLKQVAELRLDPPDLGPLRVSLTLQDGVASAVFVSAHPAVRQALESALPSLEQSLAQAGISLGQANVSDQGTASQQAQQGLQAGTQGRSGNGESTDGLVAEAGNSAATRRIDSNALVDTFA